MIPNGPSVSKVARVRGDVLFNSDWLGSADQLDEVVHAGEDAVPIVLGHVTQVLHNMGGRAGGGQPRGE